VTGALLTVYEYLPWLCGIPEPRRSRQALMAMKAFIDDSGHHGKSIHLLAGFMARNAGWDSFSAAWQSVLSRHGLPYFKANEAFNLNGCFSGWNADRRDEVTAILAHIIYENVLVGISSSVFLSDYKTPIEGRIAPAFDNPYIFLYFNVMYSAFKWQIDNEICESTDFIYDEQLHEKSKIADLFTRFRNNIPSPFRKMLGSRPIYADDKLVLPIQAADFLAWFRHRTYQQIENDSLLNTSAFSILEKIPHEETRLTGERLKNSSRLLMREAASQQVIYPYQIKQMIEKTDLWLTINNLEAIQAARLGDVVDLVAIPAKQMKRFRLVDKCPQHDTPHLHRKAGDGCLLEVTSSLAPES
jgi:hypothetical protein